MGPETTEGVEAPPQDPNLLGRERELAQLSAGLTDVLGGKSRLFLIVGEAGIGKSRLTESAAALARSQGLSVLSGRSWEAVDTPAYWPWIQVLRELAGGLSETTLREATQLAGQSVTSLLPGVLQDAEVGESRDQAVETHRFSLFDGLAAFFRRASHSTPLLIVLDDLHAADEPSLALLQFLGQGERCGPIMFLGTYDDQEVATRPRSAQLLSEIGRQGVVVSLAGLDESGISTMYEAMSNDAPSPELVRAIHQATQGNPFFTQEIVRMLSATGELQRPDYSTGFRVPASVEGLLRRRLESLSPATVEILQIASVIGREFNITLLQSVAELELDPLLDLLNEALTRGIVREESALGRYSFAHILVRESLYQGLTSANRMKTHRRIAEILEDSYRDAIDDHLHELAHHWFKAAQAGDAGKTLDYAKRAAEDAMTRAAYEEAARLYHRAVKVAETAGIPKNEIRALKERLAEARGGDGSTTTPTSKPAETANVFANHGDYWVISFSGVTTHLKDLRGLSYISQLLQHPGREIHALDLVHAVEGVSERGPRAAEPDELPGEGLSGGDELLDPVARSQYKRRLEDLQEEIEEARTNNDFERVSRMEAEIDAITHELAASLGLGGRSRKSAGPPERARISVTKAIREALKRISDNDLALGRHLNSTVRTGMFCCYTPDERVAISWQTEA